MITKSLNIKKLDDYLTGKKEEGLTDYIINNLTESLLLLSDPIAHIGDKITEKELELVYYSIGKLSNRLMIDLNTKTWSEYSKRNNCLPPESALNSMSFTYDVYDPSEEKYLDSLTRGGRLLRRITCPATIGIFLGVINYKEIYPIETTIIGLSALIGMYFLNAHLLFPEKLDDVKKEINANKTRVLITLLSSDYAKKNIINDDEREIFEYNTMKKRESLIKEIFFNGRGAIERDYAKKILLN